VGGGNPDNRPSEEGKTISCHKWGYPNMDGLSCL
jgi:hypothetical protein